MQVIVLLKLWYIDYYDWYGIGNSTLAGIPSTCLRSRTNSDCASGQMASNVHGHHPKSLGRHCMGSE